MEEPIVYLEKAVEEFMKAEGLLSLGSGNLQRAGVAAQIAQAESLAEIASELKLIRRSQ